MSDELVTFRLRGPDDGMLIAGIQRRNRAEEHAMSKVLPALHAKQFKKFARRLPDMGEDGAKRNRAQGFSGYGAYLHSRGS